MQVCERLCVQGNVGDIPSLDEFANGLFVGFALRIATQAESQNQKQESTHLKALYFLELLVLGV
jgi:hypothetical protein